MAGVYTPPVQTLIDELGRLPGVGPKSAQRIAFHLLKIPAADVERLASAIHEAKERVRFCERCFNVAEATLCPICADERRDGTILCVVEESRDIVALERTGEFRGRYHVLLGCMNPLEGIGPEHLKIRELVFWKINLNFNLLHILCFSRIGLEWVRRIHALIKFGELRLHNRLFHSWWRFKIGSWRFRRRWRGGSSLRR